LNGKRFRYALEPVLLTRQWSRDALLVELGNANSAVAEQVSKLEALEKELAVAATDSKANAAASAGLSVDRLRITTTYMRDLAARRNETKQRLTELEHERDELTQQLARSQKAVEAVESHKEESKLAFRKIQAAAAIKESDDHWSMLQQHTGNS
jgi:flagellar export protein FliJ